jgi:hypothetical protein
LIRFWTDALERTLVKQAESCFLFANNLAVQHIMDDRVEIPKEELNVSRWIGSAQLLKMLELRSVLLAQVEVA